jgi:glutaconyl-CoA/methylmalonyl-CoA decarboxylase subunit delta
MNTIILNISDLNAENATIAIVGILIVFAALAVLFMVFSAIPKILEWQNRFVNRKKGIAGQEKKSEEPISSEVNAAIGAALYLYLGEIHDEENTIMTIKKVSKTYSPWSSKLYTVRWPIR